MATLYASFALRLTLTVLREKPVNGFFDFLIDFRFIPYLALAWEAISSIEFVVMVALVLTLINPESIVMYWDNI